MIERYAARWSIEIAIADARQLFGAGQARNRTATAGYHPDDITERRNQAPWYPAKSQPSTTDMITELRRVLTATQFPPTHPEAPTPAEIHTLRLAWNIDAA